MTVDVADRVDIGSPASVIERPRMRPLNMRRIRRKLCPKRVFATVFAVGAEYRAIVYDAHDSGVGLICTQPITVDSVVDVQFYEDLNGVSTRDAIVRHATALPDKRWLVGIKLSEPLPDSALLVMLSPDISPKA
jgi:hypothetical protein